MQRLGRLGRLGGHLTLTPLAGPRLLFVRLDPLRNVAHIFRVERPAG
jgi:hypothetical protein